MQGQPAAPPSLDALGILHGTDKSSRTHGYLPFYETALAPLRRSPVRLLEVGVLGGASLRMWRDYFPRGRIVGVDRDPASLAHAGDRIRVVLADQDDQPRLARLAARLGPFDVVVEDGSHIWSHQIATLRTLLPHVKPGGFYLLEDLHTGYGRWAPKYRGEGGETGAAYAWRLAERVLAAGALVPPEPDDAFLRDAPALVDSVQFARRCAVFRRRA